MYRHKDRLLKAKKIAKKENSNKDDKPKIKEETYHNYGDAKAIQQYINDKYDIKVHKNAIRQVQYEVDDKPTGNTTKKHLSEIINEINVKDIPIDWNYKRDKTRWNTNKNKSKKERDNDLKKITQY